ncbi:uncharacterized protein LOC133034265 [Cannabis sativa]|uniref:uncharacterized protein LOC133034265 n=1 Tax=Cannabis sativa TaxID=3483 RepID=UPI0029CA3CD5|nr:uncharacterized protein LOC133034265 [Cannabis sativa]
MLVLCVVCLLRWNGIFWCHAIFFVMLGVWAAAGRDVSSLLSWLNDTSRLVDGESMGRVVMLCWAIWSARNDLLWKQRVRSVRDVVVFANSSLDQWLKAQGKGPLMSPLKEGDVRNTNGNLVAAFVGFKHGKVSPELAEIMGIREALSWLKNHTYTQAILEIDSLVCVKAIQSVEIFASTFGLVVEDCKNILKNLLNVSVFFVEHFANRVAHFVARHSISLPERMFSINSVPLELMSILTSVCSSQ